MTPEQEKEYARLLPKLARAGDVQGIAAILPELPLPEKMAAEVFVGDKQSSAARCGVLGFSFPLWRFPAQGARGASLLEHFGMARLDRATDLRDGSLPDPARDEFGVGFCIEYQGCYIEYRRAYLMCADKDGCLVIRNSSYFFGRDRLPSPVSFARGNKIIADWQAITPADFLDDGLFKPWRAGQANHLLECLEAFDARFFDWCIDGGLAHLSSFLRAKLEVGRGLPFVGWVADGMPPWMPVDVQPLTAELVEELPFTAKRQGYRLALLSGPTGDIPLA